MEEKREVQTTGNILAKYNACYKNSKATQMRFQRPLRFRIIFCLIYIVIIAIVTRYGYRYAKENNNYFLEVPYVTSCFFAGSLVLCGIWSLLQNIYYHFARKSMKKLLPELFKQQEDMLHLKHSIINNLERRNNVPLTRPYIDCPYPPQLKTQWKEQERILHDLNLLELLELPNRLRTTSVFWFIAAITVAVVSLVAVVTIYVVIAISVLMVLFIMLTAYFSRNDDPRMSYTSYSEPLTAPKYREVPSNTKETKKSESTYLKIKRAKKEAKNKIRKIKGDLAIWGYDLPGII